MYFQVLECSKRCDIDSGNQGKKKITYVSWCFLCKSLGEDVDHLILHCRGTNQLLEGDSSIVWGALGVAEHSGCFFFFGMSTMK